MYGFKENDAQTAFPHSDGKIMAPEKKMQVTSA